MDVLRTVTLDLGPSELSIFLIVETESYYVAQVGLKLVANLLPQPSNCWNHTSDPPDSVYSTTSAVTPFPKFAGTLDPSESVKFLKKIGLGILVLGFLAVLSLRWAVCRTVLGEMTVMLESQRPGGRGQQSKRAAAACLTAVQ